MIKYIILMVTPLLAGNSIAAQDANFYRLHPVELQQALEKCPATHPVGVSCEQLDECATRANKLVSELQHNPQTFGQKILILQEDRAKLEAKLKGNSQESDLRGSLDSNKMQLSERLAVVKWLESPRG